jgi:predicted permease
MRLWAILRSRGRSLFLRRRREADLSEELQLHIDRETERLRESGLSGPAARHQALRTFGGVEQIKDVCRDARRTELFHSVLRDMRYAWRSFRRTPLLALTIVTTIGLGLGLVTVVFTLLNASVFRADDVRDPHELFAVERVALADGGGQQLTWPEYDALVRDTSVFSGVLAMSSDIDVWVDGRRMEGPLVTGNFFDVLGARAARGRTVNPSDDIAGAPPAVVLSHRAWSRNFQGDPEVVGRTVLMNGSRVHVIGVMPEGFRGLAVMAPDFWAPLALRPELAPGRAGGEEAVGVHAIGRLKRGLLPDQALQQLQAWDAAHTTAASTPPAVPNLMLVPRQGTIPFSADVLLLFMPLFFAFGLVLMIGWANVANLLLARAVARQREIGIRLAIGASRLRIIRQLLVEGVLLALASAVLALGISRLVLTAAIHALASTWQPGFGDIRLVAPPADWRVALFLVAGALVSTLCFALAPALRATGLELVRTLRGEVVRDARPGRARNTLLSLQVTASVLLLTCAAVFLRSTWAAASADPGIHTADVVTVDILNDERRTAILDVVRSEPFVLSMAASWPGGLGGRPTLADTAIGKSTVASRFVSPKYFDVLGVDLVRGRGFRETEVTPDAGVAVLSESAARQLWPEIDAVGQILRLDPAPNGGPPGSDDPLLPRTVVVVGIARDVAGFRLAGATAEEAVVYLPVGVEAAGTAVTVRVRGDSDRARNGLIERLTAIDPNMAEVTTMRTIAAMDAYILAIPFWLTLVLGMLALLLTLSGLFSVLSYLVEQRTGEIGVRMALGATSRSVGVLVLTGSARPVVIGMLAGSCLTAALGGALLATPAAEQIGSAVRLFDPIAYAASVLCVMSACTCAALVPARRAGRIEPVTALRQG